MLNLIVIKSNNLLKAVQFYELLGISFAEEQHGKGPLHYAGILHNDIVFEIYPTTKKDSTGTDVRLGFNVDDLNSLIETLIQKGYEIAQPPKSSPWGYRAVVIDPDQRKVELLEKTS